jgi:uncharacterized RDD family membrane protein YckC
MSSSPPPQDPYQQQPHQQQPYQQAPYQQQPYQPGPGQPPAWPQSAAPGAYGVPRVPDARGRPLAEYAERVIAWLIDFAIAIALHIPGTLLIILGTVPAWDGAGDPNGLVILLGVVLTIAATAVVWFNQGWTQGSTGQSWGKGFRHIRLVAEDGGGPMGGGMGLLRYLIRNLLSSITGVYWLLDMLWPLWDEKRQTFEDKMLRTLVVSER